MHNKSKIVEFVKKQKELKRLSHAYLLVGNQTESQAEAIASLLLCETGQACGKCNSCIRVKNNQHINFKKINPDENLKKEDVLSIQSFYSQTSLEKNPYKVYLIYNIEDASLSALNSLLKFLEEPFDHVVAILLTSSLNRVLDTIQSRCTILFDDKNYFKTEDKQAIVNHLLDDKKGELENLDDRTKKLYQRLLLFLDEYDQHPQKALTLFYTDLSNNLKPSRQEFKFILNLMLHLSSDLMLRKTCLKQLDKFGVSANVNLLIDEFFIQCLQGGSYDSKEF